MKRITLILLVMLIAPVMAVAPTSNFYLVPTDMKVYSMVPYDATVYQDGTYTIAVNRTGGIINATLISAHTDDIPIQAAINNGGIGQRIFVNGNFIISNSLTVPISGTTIEFSGNISLDDKGVLKNYMIGLNGIDITLINPRFDFNRDINQNAGTYGSQCILLIPSSANNIKIFGGKFSRSRNEAIENDGTNIFFYGTETNDTGEHGVYAVGDGSTYGFNQYYYGMKIYHPASAMRGYGMKFNGVINSVVDGASVEFATGLAWSDWTGFVVTGGSQNINIKGSVKNALYGVQISGKNGVIPNRGISVSLNCVNCTAVDAIGAWDDIDNCKLYDSQWDVGVLYPNGFNTIDNVVGTGSVVMAVDPASDIHTSYKILNSKVHSTIVTGYAVDLQGGSNIVIDKNTFENDNHTTGSYSSFRIKNVNGSFITNNVFKGGTHYGIYLGTGNTNMRISQNFIGLGSTLGYFPQYGIAGESTGSIYATENTFGAVTVSPFEVVPSYFTWNNINSTGGII